MSFNARSGEASTRRGWSKKILRHGSANQGQLSACARMDLCSGDTTIQTRKLGVYSIRLGTLLVALIVLALWLRPSLLSASMPESLDWRNYGNDLANTRFQSVDQINRSNVSNLRVAWVFHTGVLDELAELQASPIVIDGQFYVTDGHDNLFALDPATGRLIWSYRPLQIPGEMPPLDEISVCCGRNNKGVAVGDGKVFYGRLDDVVVALDAETGAVIWRTRLASFRDHYAINNAPQFVDRLVIISL